MFGAACLGADVLYYLCCTQKMHDVLFPRATLEIGYVCTQVSPRPNFVDGIVTLSKWRWKIGAITFRGINGLLSLGLGSFRINGL